MTADLLVLGTGLLGTSLGLALADRAQVLLSDPDADRLGRAVTRGAGQAWDGVRTARVVVVCTPPSATVPVLLDAQRRGCARTYTHVASVQDAVQRGLAEAGAELGSVCGGHPMAGRERSGPDAADGGLFTGRPWVLCPGPATSGQALADVRDLAQSVGAESLQLDPATHDAAVALVSHLPQVAASALAAQLLRRPPSSVALAGPGLQDSTRIAASDPAMWREVLTLNAANVAPLVRALAEDLAGVAGELERLAAGQPGGVEELLRAGVQGRHLVPVKRGERDAAFVALAVQVPDRPGQIARVLTTAADAGVNVEDVRVEHVPGRARGVVELLVRAEAGERARQVLREAGWELVGP